MTDSAAITMKKPSRVSRRGFIQSAGIALAAASCARLRGAGAERRPNVIFAFSDEHRAQALSFTETPAVHTPNMKTLADQGVAFTQCVSNYPVCSPYRAMVMTGRWPYQTGVIDNSIALRADEATIGKAFQAAGYATAYVGKWHLGGVRAEPFGFDRSLIWTEDNTHWDHSRYHPAEGPPVQPKGYNATLMTDQALAFIEAHKDRPFFLMLSWNPPHSNFLDAPPDKKALYPEGSLPWRPNVPAATRADAESDEAIWNQNRWPHYQGYHTHVSAIDDEIGRLVAVLDALGIADNTLIVYTSDHGSLLGSHGVGGKRQPYEESIRVPFLARWPGVIPAGGRADALFGAIDVMPTICALAGLPVPATCVGRDFSPHALGKPGPNPEAQFIMHIAKDNASGGQEHPAPIFRGLRTRRHTYAVGPDRPLVLFDNERDPYQMTNLVDDPAAQDLRQGLTNHLRDCLQSAHDPFRIPS